MASKSIARLHTEVTANAAQFILEMDKADRAAANKGGSMRASLGKVLKDIEKDFSVPKLAKGFMSGIGIGGGMQLVNAGVTAFTDMWKEAADASKQVADHAESIRAALRGLQETRFERSLGRLADGPEKIAAIDTQKSVEQARLDRLLKERENFGEAIAAAGMNALTPWARRRYGDTTAGSVLKQASTDQKTLDDQIDKSRLQVEKLGDMSAEAAAKLDAAGWKRVAEGLKQFNDGVKQAAEDLKRRAAAFRSGIETPLEELIRKNREVTGLFDKGAISREEADRGLKRNMADFEKATNPLEDARFKRFEQAAGGLQVDAMTKRGLGVGVDYAAITKETQNILKEIKDLIAAGLRRQAPAVASSGGQTF